MRGLSFENTDSYKFVESNPPVVNNSGYQKNLDRDASSEITSVKSRLGQISRSPLKPKNTNIKSKKFKAQNFVKYEDY